MERYLKQFCGRARVSSSLTRLGLSRFGCPPPMWFEFVVVRYGLYAIATSPYHHIGQPSVQRCFSLPFFFLLLASSSSLLASITFMCSCLAARRVGVCVFGGTSNIFTRPLCEVSSLMFPLSGTHSQHNHCFFFLLRRFRSYV